MSNAIVNLSSSGTVITGQTGRTIRVYGYILTSAAAVTCQWQDNVGTPNNYSGPLHATEAAAGGLVAPHNPEGWFDVAVGQSLVLTLSGGSGAVGGHVNYAFIGGLVGGVYG